MLQQFLNHIDQNKLFTRYDKVLLAISGGIDSMAMLHLFKDAGYVVGVAHCNFKLRGEESDGDEDLVRLTCKDLGIPFYSKRFDTEIYAWEQGISVQMAARDLRYGFFHELLNTYGFACVATAHHSNDNLETVLLNLVRGTGIEGLAGIPVKQNNTVRPLLFATRASLEEYAHLRRIKWREDSSNASDKYYRNLIRNQVVPILKTINTNLEDGFQNTVERLRGSAAIQETALRNFSNESIRVDNGLTLIDRNKLRIMPHAAVVLWELLKVHGFNFGQCQDVIDGHHQTGKVFFANHHQLTVDRDHYILSEKQDSEHFEIQVNEEQSKVSQAHASLEFNTVNKLNFNLVNDLQLGQLDRDKVTYPLIWRSWKPGDQFVPLGMQHHKKLSDFLIDRKISIPEKNQVTVVESAGKIIWVAGHRIDDRVKITDQTERVLVIKKV